MGHINGLWRLLDENKDGIISLRELDAEVGEAVGELFKILLDKFGSIVEGWKKGLDADGNGWLDKDEFVKKCKDTGYTGNAKRLFHFLQPEPGRRHITLDDFGPKEKE